MRETHSLTSRRFKPDGKAGVSQRTSPTGNGEPYEVLRRPFSLTEGAARGRRTQTWLHAGVVDGGWETPESGRSEESPLFIFVITSVVGGKPSDLEIPR